MDDRALSPGCLACVHKGAWRVWADDTEFITESKVIVVSRSDVLLVVSVNLFTCYACVVVNDVLGYINIRALHFVTQTEDT